MVCKLKKAQTNQTEVAKIAGGHVDGVHVDGDHVAVEIFDIKKRNILMPSTPFYSHYIKKLNCVCLDKGGSHGHP